MNIKAALLQGWKKLKYELSFLLGKRQFIETELVKLVGPIYANQFKQACLDLLRTELGKISINVVAALKAVQPGPVDKDKALAQILLICEKAAIKASPMIINLFINIVENKLEGKFI